MSSPVSAANPTITWPGSRVPVSSTRMSGLRVSASGSGSADPFLILLAAKARGPEVGDRRGHHHGVGALRRGEHRLAQLAGRTGPHHVHRGRVAQLRGVRGDQRHRRAALRRDPGERVALPARRAVAEEADGVEGLAGAARGDHHPPAGEVAGQRVGPLQQQPGQLGDLGGLGQAPGPGVAAGEPARGRLHDDRAAATQQRHVVPRGRVLPHLGVHRGHEQHRAAGREQRGGEQVVRAAVRGAGQQVRRRRGDDDEVGLLAELDVRDRRARRRTPRCARAARTAPRTWRRRRTAAPTPWAARGPRARSRSAAGAARTPCRRRCRRRPRAGPGAASRPRRPVRVDAPARYSAPSVCSSRPAWISRMAIDSGFSRGPGSTSGPTYSSRPSPSCE